MLPYVLTLWLFRPSEVENLFSMTIKPSSTIIIEVKHDSRIPSGDHILARTEVTLESLLEKERNRPEGEGGLYLVIALRQYSRFARPSYLLGSV